MTGSPNVCAVVTKDTTEMEDGRWEIHTLYAEAAVTKYPVLSPRLLAQNCRVSR